MKALHWVGVIGVIGVAGVMAWRASPVGDALEAVKRLQLVWPNIQTMPPSDRELLSQLASACDLAHAPAQREAVISCLRQGLTTGRATLHGDTKNAPAVLESLISHGST